MNTKITNKDIAKYLCKELRGNEHVVEQLDAFPNYVSNSISFLNKKHNTYQALKKNITIITLEENKKYFKNNNCALIISDYPKFDFARVFKKFFS